MSAMDWEGLVYDPLYGAFGTPASLTPGTGGAAIAVTVIDKTTGVDIDLSGIGLPVLKPVVYIRLAELATHSLGLLDMADGTVNLNGNNWAIKLAKPRPGPDGKGSGEAALVLLKDG